VTPVELAGFLAFSDGSPVAGGGVERGDASTACAKFFGQGALGGQFDFQLAAEQLAFEQRVLANIRRDHFADLMAFEQYTETKAVDAAIIGNNRKAFDATALYFRDQVFRDATQTETTGQDRHVIG
jgi:hypothetical protein